MSIGESAFGNCPSLAILLVSPQGLADGSAPAAPPASKSVSAKGNVGAVKLVSAAAAATCCNTDIQTGKLAVVEAYNRNQFPAAVKLWATADIIVQLNGPFAACTQFADVPDALRAAPDATTWAGVQLWQWWLPPSSFAAGGGDDCRAVSQPRVAMLWSIMLSAYKSSEVLDLLPELEPELWGHIFTFLKHDQPPTWY